MAQKAKILASSVAFWFRRQYNLPATDPRFLQMTAEGLLVEYEATLAAEGETLKECPRCEMQTFRRECPECGISLSGDKQVDDVLARMESGEDLGDLDELLRPKPGEEFAPLTPGDVP